MEWTLLTEKEYVTTGWSGGTTTQLAIAPEGAVYADRDFLWRLSSAGVELEHSDFTPLPDYDRLISVLKGGMELKIGAGERFPLAPYQVCAFDGGVPVESWGRCTDFNLMVRKGQAQGTVQSLALASGSALEMTPALPATADMPRTVLALYCAEGCLSLPGVGLTVRAGRLLLCEQPGTAPIRLESGEGAVLMAASIRSK